MSGAGGDNPIVILKAVSDESLGLQSERAVFLRTDQNGNLFVATRVMSDGGVSRTPVVVTGTDIDGAEVPVTPAKGGMDVVAYNYAFNGTSFDAIRNNTEETILASAARTATVNSADFINYNAKGLHVILNISALAATPSIVPTIQGKDPISGEYYDILVGAAITTTGINILKIYPGIIATPNASASDILPRTYRVSVAHADSDSITYSISGVLII